MGKKEDKQKLQQEDLKNDDKLQAILLADSFEKNFRPITLEKPKVLLPLVNVPMLEYTIEFLSQNGVEELFIFCVRHADMLKEYVSKSKWSTSINVKCISSAKCTSAGDALRELDNLGIIRSDPFILISGDVISNLDLKKAIDFHQSKRKSDPDTIMTVALKTVQRCSVGAKSLYDDLVVGMNSFTNQLLLFDDSYDRKNVKFPKELIEQHSDISFRLDLLDCHVDICSPEFMLQLSDNFDYQDIRHDFIRNEVLNWELGKHIFGYVIDKEYAVRVHDPRTYHNISHDIIRRWAYPIVPDSQLVKNSSYIHNKQYNYREKDCQIARSVSIGECVVIGRKCQIDANTTLQKSVIGARCVIGEKVEITDSHIWEDCIIESGVHIDKAIIANGCTIRKNAIIPQGCVLSYGTVIDEGVILPEFSRISKLPQDEDDMPSEILGRKGYFWTTEVNTEDLNEDNLSIQLLRKGHSIGAPELDVWKRKLWERVQLPVEESDSENDDDDDDDDELTEDTISTSKKSSVKFSDSFEVGVKELITLGFKENSPANNVFLEIKAYKFAQNKSFTDCVRASIGTLLSLCLEEVKSQSEAFKQLQKHVKDGGWCYVIIRHLTQEGSREDELALLTCLEDFILEQSSNIINASLFRFILEKIYFDGKLISEDSILSWAEERRKLTSNSPRSKLFHEKVIQDFLEWLEEEDDDDDEEEEDEEEVDQDDS